VIDWHAEALRDDGRQATIRVTEDEEPIRALVAYRPLDAYENLARLLAERFGPNA